MKLHPCTLYCGRMTQSAVCDDCVAKVMAEAAGLQLTRELAITHLRDASIVLRAATLTDMARKAIEVRS